MVIPGQKRKPHLAVLHGNFTPPRISPSCPFREQEYLCRRCHRKTDRHDLLYGQVDPLATLLAALMHLTAQVGLRAPRQSRCPFSVFTRHTSGCIYVSGYSVFKLQWGRSSPNRNNPPSPKSRRIALSENAFGKTS